jgi:hypothetical protein
MGTTGALVGLLAIVQESKGCTVGLTVAKDSAGSERNNRCFNFEGRSLSGK